jgi:hypothetical protein
MHFRERDRSKVSASTIALYRHNVCVTDGYDTSCARHTHRDNPTKRFAAVERPDLAQVHNVLLQSVRITQALCAGCLRKHYRPPGNTYNRPERD